MRLSLLTTLVWLILIAADAQTTFSGRVVADDSKRGLGWASVVAENDAHKPVAFTQTKENGTFVLKIPEGKQATYITASMLGYAKQTINIGNFHNGQTIALKEEQLQLKEVKVTSKRLKQRSDTLVYSVAGFRQAQDRSIADVIAKMPGLEVSQTGVIKYQGKPITDFYIEGLDMMGGNYSMASENINANKVKNVEVLTNHQKVKALRGVQFSDHAALNIVLEEDAKNTWIGLLEAGLGATLQDGPADRLLRDGRLMAMMFGGKKQSLSMYKWNNTGKDIKNELRDLTNTIRTMDDTPNMTSNIGLSAPDLMQQRYLMNDSRLLATNWLHKVGNDATLRLQLNGYLDETEGHRSTETVYSSAMGGDIITEDAQGERNSSEWKGELKYEKNGSKLFVTNVVSGYIDFNKGWAETMLNGSSVRQQSSPRKRWINENLQIVKALGNDRTLRFNASAGYSYMPGTLLLIDSTSQHIDQHATKASINAQFRHKLLGKLYISYLAGIDYNDQRFYIRKDMKEAGHEDYQQLNSYLQPSLNLQRNSLKWTLSLPLRLISQHSGHQHLTKIIAEPSTRIEYQLTSSITAKGSYQYGWRPAMLASFTEVPVYTNYRSYTTGIGEFYASESHIGTLRLEYANPIDGLFGNVDASCSYQDKMPVYNNFLDGLVYHSEATGEYRSNTSWVLGGRLSKSLGSMKFMMTLNGQMARTYSTAMMNGQQWPFRYDNYRAGISFSLRPWQILSIEESSHYQYGKQNSSDNHALDSRAIRSFDHQLKIFILPKNWQIEWTNEMYHSNDQSVSFNYFSDVQVSYRTKTIEASIRMSNIFGNSSYERRHVSSYATTCTINRLRPKEILAKISIDL